MDPLRETTVALSKQSHTEEVIRKSLYWLSAHAGWLLEATDTEWRITLTSDDPESAKRQLFRLVNDHILREKLDQQTFHLRRTIAQRVLSEISQRSVQ